MKTSAKIHQFGNSAPEVAIINSDSKEPALRTAANVVIPVAATLGVIQLLWPNLVSEDVKNVILTVIVILMPFITAFFTRGHVWSPASVKDLINQVSDNLRNHYTQEQMRAKHPYERPDKI